MTAKDEYQDYLDMTEECLGCEQRFEDDENVASIAEHEVCVSCYGQILEWDRCRTCYEYGHHEHECPDSQEEHWNEPMFNPITRRWRMVDNHPSLTNWERNNN